jgi:hypothetical protein
VGHWKEGCKGKGGSIPWDAVGRPRVKWLTPERLGRYKSIFNSRLMWAEGQGGNLPANFGWIEAPFTEAETEV